MFKNLIKIKSKTEIIMPTKILVLNGPSYGSAVEELGSLSYSTLEFFTEPEKFKLVLFTGGSDVDPSFYGDTSPKNLCRSNIGRDEDEKAVFEHALKHNVKMAGICRGLQFINVMAGGKLIHHLDGHEGFYHDFECQKDDRIRRVNTLHHQMVIPPSDGIIVGWNSEKLSERYIGNKDEVVNWPGPEVEAAIYPEINACGVQWHPEMMLEGSDGYQFFYNMVRAILHLTTEDFVNLYTGNITKVKAAE